MTSRAQTRALIHTCMCAQATPFHALSDPVLASFPGVLADNHLLVEMLLKWRDLTEKVRPHFPASIYSLYILAPTIH